MTACPEGFCSSYTLTHSIIFSIFIFNKTEIQLVMEKMAPPKLEGFFVIQCMWSVHHTNPSV